MKTVINQLSQQAKNHTTTIDSPVMHIGCSGYYYGYWREKFYPKGISAKDYLRYYSSVFNSVELNSTFYRAPSLSQLQKYREATGNGFSFSVKMSKYITHILRLKESKLHIKDFQSLIKKGLSEKAKCFLFQFPASFQFSEENLDRVLTNIPHHPENIIEFRHISWWKKDVLKEMKNAKLTFCNIDYPKLEVPFQQTTNVFYFRLHGNPILFKSSYSVDQLTEFYKNFPKSNAQYWIFFNNTYYEAGYQNARELVHIIS